MKIFLANWELKVLAVLAAVIFWILVIGTENTFYTFPDEIQIKAFNVSEDLVVSGDLGKVKLRLKMSNPDTSKSLTADDFNAYIDLQGLREGQIEVPVLVSSKKPEVSVLRVDPSKIKVNVEKRAEKEVTLDNKIIGNLKEGYEVKEVLIAQEKVIVKGSQAVLNNVNTATVVIELAGEDKDIKKVFPIKVFDSTGNEMPDVTIDTPDTETEVKISAKTGQKLVGIKPNIIGTPSQNVWIKSINVTPSVVMLNGSEEDLKNIEFASTKGINVENISNNETYTVTIEGLPDGITAEGNPQISVSVIVGSFDSGSGDLKRKTVNVPVVVRKFKAPQANYTLDPRTITLVAEGSQENLDKISSSLQVELDITAYEDNHAEINIDAGYLDLPAGVDTVSITPSKVSVDW